MRRRVLGMALMILAAIFSASVKADIVHFLEGGEVDLPIEIQGESVVVETPMRKYRFPRSDFSRIESRPNPARDWPERRSKAIKGGADERLAAALWALDFGLVPEAESMLREALAADPKHQPSGRMVAVLDRLKPDLPDPEIPPLLRGSTPSHRIARGSHTLLIHEHSDAEAMERIEILERVITAYYLYFASLGIELAVPQTKLPSLWFARKSDYLAFLRAEGADAFLTTRGYHHPTRGLVAAYDCRDDPPRLKAKDALLARRDELDRFSARVKTLPKGSRFRVTLAGVSPREFTRENAQTLASDLTRQVDRKEMMLELSRREIDWGVAAHETVHQLVSTSRLAPRHDRFPNWLHEGLAMQFETIHGGRWAGLGTPSPFRLRDYRRLKSPPDLIATTLDAGFGRGYQEESYARAWSLVYYLRTQRPSSFVAILDGLRAPTDEAESPSAQSSRLLVASLPITPSEEELRWRGFMDSLPASSVEKSNNEHP